MGNEIKLYDSSLFDNKIEQNHLEIDILELEQLLEKKITRLGNLRYDERHLKEKIQHLTNEIIYGK